MLGLQWLAAEDRMKFTYKGNEFYIHKTLAYQLVSIMYNLKKDWDFVILITGDRKVRVGKSVLAMTICAYMAYLAQEIRTDDKPLNMDAFGEENIFFDNKVMMKEAQKRAKYSIIQYDEAREGLAASKAMKSFQQDLIDFFAECGQLNHVFVIVCPDFFELKEEMAVGRSEFLLNVYRREETKMMDVLRTGVKMPITVLKRGYFEFFNRSKKSLLYDISKSTRKKNYGLVKARFLGDFVNQYTVDEAKYKEMKKDSLTRFQERHKEQKEDKNTNIRNTFIIKQHIKGLKSGEIISRLEENLDLTLSKRQINRIIKEWEEETKTEEETEPKASETSKIPKETPFWDKARGDYTTNMVVNQKNGGNSD